MNNDALGAFPGRSVETAPVHLEHPSHRLASTGSLRVRGHQLEYASWEPSGATASTPAIVLLHEGLGSVTAWRTFPADLAERTGWRVFALQPPRLRRIGFRRAAAAHELHA